MHAIVTGASSGIGEAIAKALAVEGYDLTLIARRESELHRVADEMGQGVTTIVQPFDLTSSDGLDALVARAENDLGPVDLLVNNAGHEIVARSMEVEFEDIERIMRVNFLAPCALTRAVASGMFARRKGTIVNVASAAAYAPPPLLTYYSASKAALAAFSVSIRGEFKRHGVHVVTVYPGVVRTAMIERGVAGYRRNPTAGLPWGRPETLARRVVRAIKRRHTTVVFPSFYWFPWWFPRFSRFVMDAIPSEASEKCRILAAGVSPSSMLAERDHTGRTSNTAPARRLTHGEMTFDGDIGLQDRDAMTEMWVNRLCGFHNLRTDQYLRDSVAVSHCRIAGRTWTDRGLRRLCSVLFPAQRVARLIGFDFSLELLDAHSWRESEGFMTSCVAVAYIARRIIRQSRLRMLIVRNGGRLVWGQAVEEPLPRGEWRYELRRADKPRMSFALKK